MRFLLVDRVLAMEKGRRIETVKAFALSEECFRGHFTRRALVPGALLVECLAQSVGRLICATHDFTLSTVLTVLEDVVVAHDLPPGAEVRVTGELLGTSPKGSVARARATADGRVVASAGRMLFGQFPHPDPEQLRARMRLFGWDA
jgi:3-hydroxyacyl-[acyl-carrier-protein] dehydratase